MKKNNVSDPLTVFLNQVYLANSGSFSLGDPAVGGGSEDLYLRW